MGPVPATLCINGNRKQPKYVEDGEEFKLFISKLPGRRLNLKTHY